MDEPPEQQHGNIDAANNGSETNCTIWVFAALATLFLGLRVSCKYKRRSSLWCDDGFLIAAWVLLILSCVLVSVNIANGFGKHDKDIDQQRFDSLGLRNVVVGSLYSVSAAWSKTSFAISLLRIATPRLRILIWFLVISMNIFMYIDMVVSWTTCRPLKKLWQPSIQGQCWPSEIILPMCIFFNVYSGFVDFVLALLSWSIITKLQINLKEKIGVAVAMSMGVFAGVTAIIKSVGLNVLDDSDFNYLGVELVIRNVAEIATTIVAASIPILRTLVSDWVSLRGGRQRNRNEADRAPEGYVTASNTVHTRWTGSTIGTSYGAIGDQKLEGPTDTGIDGIALSLGT